MNSMSLRSYGLISSSCFPCALFMGCSATMAFVTVVLAVVTVVLALVSALAVVTVVLVVVTVVLAVVAATGCGRPGPSRPGPPPHLSSFTSGVLALHVLLVALAVAAAVAVVTRGALHELLVLHVLVVVASVLHELLVLDELVDVGKLLEGFEVAKRGKVKEVMVKGARHDEVGVWESQMAEGWGGEWLGAGSNHPRPPPKTSCVPVFTP